MFCFVGVGLDFKECSKMWMELGRITAQVYVRGCRWAQRLQLRFHTLTRDGRMPRVVGSTWPEGDWRQNPCRDQDGTKQINRRQAAAACLQVWVRLERRPVLVRVAGAVAHAVAVLAEDDGAVLTCKGGSQLGLLGTHPSLGQAAGLIKGGRGGGLGVQRGGAVKVCHSSAHAIR